MSDPISASLVDRVERSLRRRLNTDVRPHLLRYAARADSIDAFMASAARLIVDTHDREHWLAGWTPARRNRHPEAEPESESSGPDSTGPAPLDAIPSTLDIGEPATEQLVQALAFEIGPMAKRVVETEVRQSHSVSELLYRLQAHLEEDVGRRRFIAAANSALGR
jgi:hypothetical protein